MASKVSRVVSVGVIERIWERTTELSHQRRTRELARAVTQCCRAQRMASISLR